jgi:hypothetical protein
MKNPHQDYFFLFSYHSNQKPQMKKFTMMVAALFCLGISQAQSTNKGRISRSNVSTTNSVVTRNSTPINPAAIIFTDAMDADNSIAGLTARGYTTYFRGAGGPGAIPEWYQGAGVANGGSFDAFNGPDSGFVGSTFNSVTGINDVDNWLVLPAQNLAVGDSLSFWSQAPFSAPPVQYVDSIRVMYNPTGATLPEDLNWVELDRFQATNAGAWERSVYAIPTASANGVIAIRHTVADSGPLGINGDNIGIDQIDLFNAIPATTFDDCSGAIDINSAFGGTIGAVNNVGPYDNTTATTVNDPTVGWECFGEPDGSGNAPELNNSVWFTFTGDGNNYFIESGNCAGVTNYISDGDTQFALYSGSCTSLTPVKCNEDGPSATATTYPAGFTISTVPGETYYLLVDGFSFNGVVSIGQFCLKVSKLATIACADTSVSVGTVTQNVVDLCFNDTLVVSASGAISPNVGDFFGISWIISSADISASPDPLTDPAVIATYTFSSPAPTLSTRQFINDGTSAFIAAGNTYYWTPIVFGNAVALNTPPQFLSDLTLDNTCITLGASLAVNVLVDGDPLCSGVGINETPASAYGISSIFPVPAKDVVNFVINAKESSILSVSVKDNLGKIISTQKLNAVKGINQVVVDLSGKASGVYFVTVSGDKGDFNTKFSKQ